MCGCDNNTAETDSSAVDQSENITTLNGDVDTPETDVTIQNSPNPNPVILKCDYLYNSLDEMLNNFELNGTNELYSATEDTAVNVRYASKKPASELIKSIDCLFQNGLYNITYDGKMVDPVTDAIDYGYAVHLDGANKNMLSRYRFKIDTEYGEGEMFLTVYCDYEEKADTLEEFVEQYREDMYNVFPASRRYNNDRLEIQNCVDVKIGDENVKCLTNVTYNEIEEKYIVNDYNGNYSPYYMFISPFSDNVLFHFSFISSIQFEHDNFSDSILEPQHWTIPEVVYTGYDWLSKFDFEKVDIGVNYDMLYELYDPQKWLDQQYQ